MASQAGCVTPSGVAADVSRCAALGFSLVVVFCGQGVRGRVVEVAACSPPGAVMLAARRSPGENRRAVTGLIASARLVWGFQGLCDQGLGRSSDAVAGLEAAGR